MKRSRFTRQTASAAGRQPVRADLPVDKSLIHEFAPRGRVRVNAFRKFAVRQS